MFRKAVIAAGILLFAISTRIHALGLGDIDAVKAVECIEQKDLGRTYMLNLDGHDPNEVAPVVARRVHEEGYRLFALYPEHHDIETVFAQVAAGGTSSEEAVHV